MRARGSRHYRDCSLSQCISRADTISQVTIAYELGAAIIDHT